MDQLLVWAEGLVSTPWIFLVVYLFVVVDGFFPPIPSESLVIAMGALWASTDQPNLVGIILAATAGAFTGDQITYQVGRMVKVRRLGWLRGARAQAVLDRSERALVRRGAAFIIAARYIPVGRVAVNLIAGALHYPRRRFMVVDTVASAMWAVYSAAVGLLAGKVLRDYPLMAVVVGVVAGAAIGLVVDWVMQRFGTPRRGALPDPGSPAQRPPDAADLRCGDSGTEDANPE